MFQTTNQKSFEIQLGEATHRQLWKEFIEKIPSGNQTWLAMQTHKLPYQSMEVSSWRLTIHKWWIFQVSLQGFHQVRELRIATHSYLPGSYVTPRL